MSVRCHDSFDRTGKVTVPITPKECRDRFGSVTAKSGFYYLSTNSSTNSSKRFCQLRRRLLICLNFFYTKLFCPFSSINPRFFLFFCHDFSSSSKYTMESSTLCAFFRSIASGPCFFLKNCLLRLRNRRGQQGLIVGGRVQGSRCDRFRR